MQAFLDALFDREHWPVLALGLRCLVLVAGLAIVVSAARGSRGGSALSWRARMFFAALCAAPFVVLLIYQASWQLTGLRRPEFVRFMQRYDRRQFNPARLARRGRILDREGRILAISREAGDRSARYYPLGRAAAHAVGYSHSRYGLSGLEAALHGQLYGGGLGSTEDWKRLGRQILEGAPDTRGKDIRCTLDAVLQKRAFSLLGDRAGAVVMMDVRTGELLVVCSAPAFDPNAIGGETFATAEQAPVFNRALQGLYPPGSTFKLVAAGAALSRGLQPVYDCPASGYTTSSKYPAIRDHEYYEAERRGATWDGQGRIDLAAALAKSSNVFFARLGVDLGWEAMSSTMRDFGMGARQRLLATDSGSIAAAASPLPPHGKNDLYGLAQASIGQGRVLATPFQMAWICATIGNGGVRPTPRLLPGGETGGGARVMSEENALALGRMMFDVVEIGTARGLRGLPFATAGKTGTAQNAHGDAHSWFCGFAPYDRPRVAVAVIVEHGGYGSARAVPISRALLRAAFEAGVWPR